MNLLDQDLITFSIHLDRTLVNRGGKSVRYLVAELAVAMPEVLASVRKPP